MPSSSSSGSSKSNTTRTSNRQKNISSSPVSHQIEYELGKNGELVPVSGVFDPLASQDDQKDSEEGLAYESNEDHKVSVETFNMASSRSKRKQTFERRNIKCVLWFSYL